MLDPVYMVCDTANIDASGNCSSPFWAELPTLVPPLSLVDGAEIALAILTLWAIAYSVSSVAMSIMSGDA